LRPDLKELPVGKYEIEGEQIFAMVSRVCGRRKESALLETHDKYIDIQLVISGTDVMGWKPRAASAGQDYCLGSICRQRAKHRTIR